MFDGTNFLYMDANDEQQTKAFDVREVEGVTATPAYLDTEGHRGTLSGTTFTYEVDVTKEIQEDFLFEAATINPAYMVPARVMVGLGGICFTLFSIVSILESGTSS